MSNMTLEDFNVPLKSKLHGTRNLYAAFEHLPLNFFIILSSISGVIGVGGQASYAAGNTFQDAFAMSAQSEEFPCLSLDIGLIENAKYNNSARENNLKRHGLIPMKSQDLLDLLEYAMSSRIAPDQCKQIIVGFDWRSISQVQITNATTKSPLFCHIQRPFEDEAPSTSLPIEKTLRTAVSESLDTAAVQQTVKAAISRKISSIVASDDLNQRTNSSMTELGLDSLMTTELRNWISTEFQAATQVSEILDEASIESLASLVASRSPFVSEKTRAMSGEQDEAKVKSNESFGGGSEVATEERTPSPSTELPILPLPRLENTLDMYLESRRVFLSEDESSKTSLVIAEFLKDGGFGQKLQNRLNKRYQDPNIEDWLREPYTNKIYLERRDPIHPTGTFYGGHLLGDVRHTQAERAAILAVAAFEFKSVVDDGILERDFMNGEPLCIDLL